MFGDEDYMNAALAYARRAIGQVAPNPPVACLLVKDGVVVGRGVTARGGRPHAETVALKQAGAAAEGATAYVTLEPCAHQGKTGSCARALVDTKIARCVIGCTDPDERVNGKGAEILKEAGVDVLTGVCEDAARDLIIGFASRVTLNRPSVTLKMATTVDGKIATSQGESQWITGELARAHVHLERSRHDAIMVGLGTVLSDDPMLTTRMKGYEHQSVRIVMDTHLRIPLDSKLVKTAEEAPLWLIHLDDSEGNAKALKEAGVKLIKAKTLKIALRRLAEEGITRLFVEGGVHLHTSFLKDKLYDRFLWYRAPSLLGREGISAIGELGVKKLVQMIPLERATTKMLGRDILATYERKAA